MKWIEYPDGSRFDVDEGSKCDYIFEIKLTPDTYKRLAEIAHEEGILTFDVGKVINFVVENFEKK